MQGNINILPLIFVFLLNFFYDSNAKIVVNEVMADPVSPQPEWIELYNPESEYYEMQNFTISDAVATKPLPKLNIPPNSYVVLTKDTSTLLQYKKMPAGAILVEIALPAFNNTTDVVVIKDGNGNVIDSLYYDMKWGKKGFSLERIDYDLPAYSQENIKKSEDKDSCTIGYFNSVSRLNYDVKLDMIKIVPNNNLKLTISNIGKFPADAVEYYIYLKNDKDGDFLYFTYGMIDELPQSESIEVNIDVGDYANINGYSAVMTCKGIVNFSKDQRRINDTLVYSFRFSYPVGSLKINEFMFEPLDDGAEFVELWNSTDEIISLKFWRLTDGSQKDTIIISEDVFIKPKGYFVICWDSLFFSKYEFLRDEDNVYYRYSKLNLNADGDKIVLLDCNDIVQDYLEYKRNWHLSALINTKGISLEKIKPELVSNSKFSWSSCIDELGATPCRVNSIAEYNASSGGVSVTPNPFSPFDLIDKQVCNISCVLPFRTSRLYARVFNLDGELLKTVINGEVVFSSYSFIWDGTNEKGYALPVGCYILLIEAISLETSDVFQDKVLIAIGK